MRTKTATSLVFLSLLLGAGALPAAAAQESPTSPPSAKSPLVHAMEAELQRSLKELAGKGEAPIHFLAYRVVERDEVHLAASLGALQRDTTMRPSRWLDVECRVGTPDLDSTHKIRDEGWGGDFGFGGFAQMLMPDEDDEAAIRAALWYATDQAFQAAQERYTKVKANKTVKVEEEDPSADFSREDPQTFAGPSRSFSIDRDAWKERLRRLSAIARDYPTIFESSVSIGGNRTRRFLVTSEGTRIQDERVRFRFDASASTTAEDGMALWLYDSADADSPGELPGEDALAARVRTLLDRLAALREAPLAEPYAGPAILRSRAAAVFFHEIFGHRMEGHRLKDEEEGRTFKGKIGETVMPPFISVVDDPTRTRVGEVTLSGHYAFDDEGVPAQPVSLVEAGVLRGFLLGRSPIEGFPHSNGHGRCSPGNDPVARQGNLIVTSQQQVPFAELRRRLLEEVEKQGKPYGLVFDEIAGGFTTTRVAMPQAFKVQPLLVWRVYADGRPDELVRGVDLSGTPLVSLEQILAAADDPEVFNGTCGAESGWVPVSAVSPSLLVKTIEVERKEKAQDRPPLLPPPLHDPEASAARDAGPAGEGAEAPPHAAPSPEQAAARDAALAGDPRLRVLHNEIDRSMARLRLEDHEGPYFLACTIDERESVQIGASFGALTGEGRDHRRNLDVDLRVGDHELDNTHFAEEEFFRGGRRGGGGMPIDDDEGAMRHAVWLATDEAYKEALETLEKKKAFLQTNTVKDRPADLSREDPVVSVEPTAHLEIDVPRWEETARGLSAIFREHPAVQASFVMFAAGARNRWFLNSEGFLHRKGSGRLSLSVLAGAQSADGMMAADEVEFVARSEDAMPSREAMEASVRDLAERLAALVDAPPVDEVYVGPVLFEGDAAAGFLGSVLLPNLASPIEPLGGRGFRAGGANPLRDRIGKRILPRFLSVIDDPLAEDWKGTPLLGGFRIDDEGVRARRIVLVEDGKLQTFCMSRAPTRPVQGSNGHARGGRGMPTNVFVETSEPLSPKELRDELFQLGEDEGLDHVYIARRLAGSASALFGGDRSFLGFGGRPGTIPLPPPLLLYRVSLEDGSETLVRGGRFGGVTVRILRDIVASGDDAAPHLSAGGPFSNRPTVHLVTPSLLVEELEIRKPEEEQDKPPAIPNPYFETP